MKLNFDSVVENQSNLSSSAFKVEANNVAFKILSTSLYEDKTQAVIRELACNAQDACIEANSEKPIHINLPTNIHHFLEIQDFGIGMSLETLTELYSTLFASSKRSSNDLVGGFGIGRVSAFSVSESFTVESVHDGIKTIAIVFLDNAIPQISIVSSKPANEPNGTKVIVPMAPEDRHKDICRELFSNWEVTPIINGVQLAPNTLQTIVTEQGTKFILNRPESFYIGYSTSEKLQGIFPKVLLGGIPYAIPRLAFDSMESELAVLITTYLSFLPSGYRSSRSTVYISAPLGTLQVSPSRERLELTPEDTERLCGYIKDVLRHLVDTFKPTVIEYVNTLVDKIDFEVIDSTGLYAQPIKTKQFSMAELVDLQEELMNNPQHTMAAEYILNNNSKIKEKKGIKLSDEQIELIGQLHTNSSVLVPNPFELRYSLLSLAVDEFYPFLRSGIKQYEKKRAIFKLEEAFGVIKKHPTDKYYYLISDKLETGIRPKLNAVITNELLDDVEPENFLLIDTQEILDGLYKLYPDIDLEEVDQEELRKVHKAKFVGGPRTINRSLLRTMGYFGTDSSNTFTLHDFYDEERKNLLISLPESRGYNPVVIHKSVFNNLISKHYEMQCAQLTIKEQTNVRFKNYVSEHSNVYVSAPEKWHHFDYGKFYETALGNDFKYLREVAYWIYIMNVSYSFRMSEAANIRALIRATLTKGAIAWLKRISDNSPIRALQAIRNHSDHYRAVIPQYLVTSLHTLMNYPEVNVLKLVLNRENKEFAELVDIKELVQLHKQRLRERAKANKEENK